MVRKSIMTKRNNIIRGKLITCLTIAACMACSLTGCGKTDSILDEVKQIESDGTQSAEKDGSQTDGTSTESAASFQKGALSESLGMKGGTWEDTISVGEDFLKEIQINVEVELPDTDHMCVVDLERKDISESQVKEIIGKLMDNGKVGVFEESRYPKWKLELLVTEYEALVAAEKKNNVEGEYVKQDAQKLEDYKSQLASATNDLIEPEKYDSGTFWGTIDGKAWRLNVSKYLNEDGYCLWGEMGNYAEALVTDMDYSGCPLTQFPTDDESVENACALSEEDAVRQAANFLAELGYDAYELKEVSKLHWNVYQYESETENNFVEGYHVCFGRTVDGVQISTDAERYTQMYSSEPAWLNYRDEQVWINITDAGVINFSIDVPCEVKTKTMTETSLLAFDKIQKIISESLKKRSTMDYFHPDSLYKVKLDQMDLVYMVLTDDGLTVIPVWRIYNVNSYDYIDNYILINAIDGSEIDLMSEYFEVIPEEEWNDMLEGN